MKPVAVNHAAHGIEPPATAERSVTAPHAEPKVDAHDQRKIRLLVFTNLYPDAARPRHGVFVEERLRHLVASGKVTATVVAPVPWFPFRHPRFGAYATFARVAAQEERHGITVVHPRYPVVPKVGMNIAPLLMYQALAPVLRNMQASGTEFDLIDAHYFYPDGVAAARLGAALGKPVVITARGSDVNVIARHRLPARHIRWAAQRAAAIITVSDALKARVEGLGVSADKVTTLRNGVDPDRFKPVDRDAIRARLGLAGPAWLTVGHLIELKGVHLAIAALAQTSDVTLLIAGDGPEKARLRDLAKRLGVEARVRFRGTVAQAELCEYYNAADAMVLASSREGMPNVVLESLACGTPVIAAPFESAAELISAPEAGVITQARTGDAIAAAWRQLSGNGVDRAATRRFAQRLDWRSVVEAQCALYDRVLSARAHGAGSGAVQ